MNDDILTKIETTINEFVHAKKVDRDAAIQLLTKVHLKLDNFYELNDDLEYREELIKVMTDIHNTLQNDSIGMLLETTDKLATQNVLNRSLNISRSIATELKVLFNYSEEDTNRIEFLILKKIIQF